MRNFLPDLWSGAGDPFRALRREMNDMLAEFGRRAGSSSSMDVGQAPPMNVAETKEAVEISMDLPGIDEKDVSVTLEGNRLVVSGQHEDESNREEKDWRIVERRSGSFYRAIALPFEPKEDAIEALFEKGVLKMRVPKPASGAMAAKRISISSGKEGAMAPDPSGATPQQGQASSGPMSGPTA